MARQQSMTAIIYDKRGNVLSIGQNSYVKTHTLQAHYAKKCGVESKVFLHAEIHAITRCRNISQAHRILVTRYDANGRPALAKPCPVCSEAIRNTPIKVIDHT